MSALNRWINDSIGLHVTPEFEDNIQFALQETAKQVQLSVAVLTQQLVSNHINPNLFFEKIVTSESFFFRYRAAMETAVKELIAPLIERGRRPNILCLPCARGEEPYSLAMIIHASGLPLNQINIVGVDISNHCVQSAKQAIYNEYAFRRTDKANRNQYFTPLEQGFFQLCPTIQKSVNFLCLNLFQNIGHLGREFDLIFFNNLLIYFDSQHATRALNIVKNLLALDGWLIIDSTESPRCREVFISQSVGEYFWFRRPDFVDKTKDQKRPREQHDLEKRALEKHTLEKQSLEKQSLEKPINPQRSPSNNFSPPNRSSLEKTQNPIEALQGVTPKSFPSRHSDPDISASTLLKQGHAAVASKHFDQAIDSFQQVIDEFPQSQLQALLALSHLYADQGNTMQAMEMAERALREIDPQQNSSPSQASSSLPKTLSNNQLADLHSILALGFRSKGLQEAAQREFELVQSLNAHHPAMRLYQPERRP